MWPECISAGLKSLSVFLRLFSNLKGKEKDSAGNYPYLLQNDISFVIKNIKNHFPTRFFFWCNSFVDFPYR